MCLPIFYSIVATAYGCAGERLALAGAARVL